MLVSPRLYVGEVFWGIYEECVSITWKGPSRFASKSVTAGQRAQNGSRLLYGGFDNIAHIWEFETGDIVSTWDMSDLLGSGLNDTDWSPDGQFIRINGVDNAMPTIRRT
jgi:WD40 repeat protein